MTSALKYWAATFLAALLLASGCGGDSSSSTVRPTPTPTPAPNGSFAPAASTPSMNVGRFDATATLLQNGDVFIAGGQFADYNAEEFASVELYDPTTNSFASATSLPSMNSGRTQTTETILPNGKVLIPGGGGFLLYVLTPFDTIDLYDPATNSFAPPASLPTMNQARAGAAVTLLNNGLVLIAGGSGDLNSVELYDPMTNIFALPAQTPQMNQGRWQAMAALLPDGKVLIAGGVGASGALNTVEIYDPRTNSFAPPAQTPTMNQVRVRATATLLPNGKVLIAGGDGNGNPALNTVELYDPATNTFAAPAQTPTMNIGRAEATATLLTNGKVLIAGGRSEIQGVNNNDVLNSVEVYDPATNSFAPPDQTPTMNQPRYGATATRLFDGMVLIAGGQEDPHGLGTKTVELYTP